MRLLFYPNAIFPHILHLVSLYAMAKSTPPHFSQCGLELDISSSSFSSSALVAEKLSFVRPETLGQAMRVSGVTPADVGVLSVLIYKSK